MKARLQSLFLIFQNGVVVIKKRKTIVVFRIIQAQLDEVLIDLNRKNMNLCICLGNKFLAARKPWNKPKETATIVALFEGSGNRV